MDLNSRRATKGTEGERLARTRTGSVPSTLRHTACACDSVRLPSCPAICFVDMIVVAGSSKIKMGSPDAYIGSARWLRFRSAPTLPGHLALELREGQQHVQGQTTSLAKSASERVRRSLDMRCQRLVAQVILASRS